MAMVVAVVALVLRTHLAVGGTQVATVVAEAVAKRGCHESVYVS